MITHYDDLEPEDLSLLNQNINKSLKSACKARMRGYQEKMMICANELKPVYQRNQFQYEDRDAFCSRPNQHVGHKNRANQPCWELLKLIGS